MSENKGNELIPRVIIQKHELSSDSEESTVFDGASTEFREGNESDDESSIVVSSTQSRDELNKESYDKPNVLTFNSIMQASDENRSKMKSVHITHGKNTHIGNETFFRGRVTFNVHREKRSNNRTKLMFTDTRKMNSTLNNKGTSIEVSEFNWFRLKHIFVPTITVILLVVSGAIYFTKTQKNDSTILPITSQKDENLGNDSDYVTSTSVETLLDVIQRIDSGYTYALSDHSRWKKLKILLSYSAEIATSEFRIISRSEWEARQPERPLTDLQQPSTRVIIAHTATSTCLTQDYCRSYIRSIQANDIKRGLEDISYNFLVGCDGSAYNGRGWEKEGAYLSRFNSNSICVAFIGTFTKIAPPQQQVTAAQKLIEEGVRLKKLVPDYRLYGHRQVSNTDSPGESLYAIIKTWEHWTDIVI